MKLHLPRVNSAWLAELLWRHETNYCLPEFYSFDKLDSSIYIKMGYIISLWRNCDFDSLYQLRSICRTRFQEIMQPLIRWLNILHFWSLFLQKRRIISMWQRHYRSVHKSMNVSQNPTSHHFFMAFSVKIGAVPGSPVSVIYSLGHCPQYPIDNQSTHSCAPPLTTCTPYALSVSILETSPIRLVSFFIY
jgi:hypothetical protein